MRFIGDIFRLLKDTTWPTREGKLERFSFYHGIHKLSFVVIIYIFDQLIVSGLIRFIKHFLEG